MLKKYLKFTVILLLVGVFSLAPFTRPAFAAEKYDPSTGIAVDCNTGDLYDINTEKNPETGEVKVYDPAKGLDSGFQDVSSHYKNECDFNDILDAVAKIIDFLLFWLAMPLAAILFAYAGFLYVSSAASPDNRKKAKAIFKGVLVGFLIALAAWLIVSFILGGLGAKNSYLQGL